MFYQVKAYRVQLREFWWETKLFIWVALIIKLFRMTPRGSTDDLAVDSLHPFEVDASRIAPETMARFEPILTELRQAGFTGEAVWHDEFDPFQATHNTLASLVHSSGQAFVRVQCRANMNRVPPKIKLFTTFISPARDAGFIVTSNGKPDMAWPATHDLQRFFKMPVHKLWAAHQSRLAQQRIVLPRVDQSSLRDYLEAHHVSLRDFHLQRGVFAEIPESEQALYKTDAHSLPLIAAGAAGDSSGDPTATGSPAVPAAPPDLLENATFAELARLQQKSSSWRAALGILGISALLFILSFRGGKASTPDSTSAGEWEFALMLVPILFIHELGHYIAMRGFGYRNLRMFFIPFFGAAVTGKHYGVPGWKKVIVSLMGPLPGIALGVVAGILGLVFNKDWLVTAGLLSLIINGFNLLPLLPFDGGWVAHAVLFSRHYMLDVGFRILAAAALIGLSLIGEKVFLYIAIAMLVSLPASITLAKVVSELRKEGFASSSPDGQKIPPEAARAIFAKLRATKKRGLTAKTGAQQILQIFETLNAKPPGAWASTAFIALHAGSIVVAAICAFGIIGLREVKRRGLDETLLAMERPTHALNPAAIRMIRENQLPREYRSIVVTFATPEQARVGGMDFSAEFETSRITQIAHILLISFPATDDRTRQAALSRWDKKAADLFLEGDSYRATIFLTCKAPAEMTAEQIEKGMMEYVMTNNWVRVSPPWATEQDWPLERRAPDIANRALLVMLQQPADMNDNTKEWERIDKERIAAIRKGDSHAVNRINAQRDELMQREATQRKEKMLAEYPDSPIVRAWFENQSETEFAKRRERIAAALKPAVGAWPEGRPTDSLIENGYVVGHGKEVQFRSIQFGHTDVGFPAMLSWLIGQGCTEFRFNLVGGETYKLPDDALE